MADSAETALKHIRKASLPPAERAHLRILAQEAEAERLERLIERRLRDESNARAMMEGDASSGSHVAHSQHSLWENRYLNARPALSTVPPSAYRSDQAARFCASDWRTCGLDCTGCDRTR